MVIPTAGGYGWHIEDTVGIHLQTVRVAAEMARTWPIPALRGDGEEGK
jgi:hypothetical protein